MSRKVKMISIPDPCNENWDEMTPVEKGRYCDSCEKVVHDVTNFSDDRLSNLLTTKPNVCVQVSSSQVGRELVVQKEGSGLLSRAAVVLGLISLTIAGNTTAQRKLMGAPVYHQTESETVKNQDSSDVVLQGDVRVDKIEVELKGVVKDPDGNTINEASVFFNDKEINTDKLGRFKIKLTVPSDQKIKVRVYKSPYVERSFYIEAKSQTNLEFKLRHYMLKGKVKKHK